MPSQRAGRTFALPTTGRSDRARLSPSSAAAPATKRTPDSSPAASSLLPTTWRVIRELAAKATSTAGSRTPGDLARKAAFGEQEPAASQPGILWSDNGEDWHNVG